MTSSRWQAADGNGQMTSSRWQAADDEQKSVGKLPEGQLSEARAHRASEHQGQRHSRKGARGSTCMLVAKCFLDPLRDPTNPLAH